MKEGKKMIKLQRQHAISASPEAVWAVLGDFMNIDRFAPEIAKVDALTEGENDVMLVTSAGRAIRARRRNTPHRTPRAGTARTRPST